MSEKHDGNPQRHGQHAHTAPTTEQLRTVGQRRRDAEEKLEHHLEEARHKTDHSHESDHEHGSMGAGAGAVDGGEDDGGEVDGGDVAAIQNDDSLTAADRVDLISNQVLPEPHDDESATGRNRPRPT